MWLKLLLNLNIINKWNERRPFSLKIIKSLGHDGVWFNVIKNNLVSCVNLLNIYLTFRLLEGIFSGYLKMTMVPLINEADQQHWL